MNRNIRARFLKEKFIMNFQNFNALVTLCSLIGDFQYAFNKRLYDEIEQKENQQKNNPKRIKSFNARQSLI